MITEGVFERLNQTYERLSKEMSSLKNYGSTTLKSEMLKKEYPRREKKRKMEGYMQGRFKINDMKGKVLILVNNKIKNIYPNIDQITFFKEQEEQVSVKLKKKR